MTATEATPAAPAAGAIATRGLSGTERAVLACVCACTVLVVGFVASINLAVPQLAASGLHPSSSQLLWIVDAYVVFFACLVIPAGAAGDRFGRKGVLIGGLLLFAAGALVSAAAGDVVVMLLGRAVTGVGAAAVLPNALAVLVHAVSAVHRRHAIAVWAAMSGIGGVIGNVGGGAILAAGSWRWLFAAVAPLAIVCALATAFVTPRSARGDRAPDVVAAVLLTVATLALLLGVVEGPEHGWTSAIVVGAFAAAVVLFGGWVVQGLRAEQPMLDPRLFRLPALRAASLGMLVAFFGLFGFFFLNASLLQYDRGFGVLRTGIAVIPLTVPLLVGARFVPRLAARVGDRTVLATAFVVTAAGLLGLAVTISAGYPAYAACMVVVGVGIALALPTLTIAIAAALPRHQAGVAGGLQATTREFGSALGVAVIGTLLTARFTHDLGAGHGLRSVAQALTAEPTRHRAVVHAYGAAAGSSLTIVAVVVLVTGALVIADLTLATRRSRRADAAPPRTPAAGRR